MASIVHTSAAHSSIPLVSHPAYSYPFPGQHRFPMEKFSLLAGLCRHRGWLGQANSFRPGKARRDLLELAHCNAYLERFIEGKQTPKEIRRMGLPWSRGLVKRTLVSPNGTFLTAQLALKHGIACHLAGGTHHAHYDFASGFCILNDLAITAKALLAQGKVKKIVIFDCDVHQGDGTAQILQQEPRAFTCSIHCEKNFPARKAQSDLDVGLPVDTNDRLYLDTVEQTLCRLIEEQQPELLLYDAGVDIYRGDPLGLLGLSMDTLRTREYLVMEICRRFNLPVATVIGGGYDDDRRALAERHSLVVEAAFSTFASSLL